MKCPGGHRGYDRDRFLYCLTNGAGPRTCANIGAGGIGSGCGASSEARGLPGNIYGAVVRDRVRATVAPRAGALREARTMARAGDGHTFRACASAAAGPSPQAWVDQITGAWFRTGAATRTGVTNLARAGAAGGGLSHCYPAAVVAAANPTALGVLTISSARTSGAGIWFGAGVKPNARAMPGVEIGI